MNSFSIDEPARAEIQRIIFSSQCSDPVLTMADAATLSLPTKIKAGFLLNAEKAMVPLLDRIAKDHPVEDGQWKLEIGAHERHECLSQDLFEVEDVTFAMGAEMREHLRDYCLSFSDHRFFLKSADDNAGSLRSVKTLAHWFAGMD